MTIVQRPARLRVRKEQLSLPAFLPAGEVGLPRDFPSRLERIKDASGLSWNEFAGKLGVESRQLFRWRRGVEPSGGAMLALMQFAMLLPDGHHILFSNDAATASPVRRRVS